MGADGGVVYIPLRNGTDQNYARVLELLSPLWQFLSTDGGASWAEEANWEWMQNNSIDPPKYVLGYYGTDRCDSFELGDLELLCSPETNDPLYELTFEELDLECRTSPYPITSSYNHHPLHKLWYQHFGWSKPEDVSLGVLTTMKVSDWAKELHRLLHLDRVVHEETWT